MSEPIKPDTAVDLLRRMQSQIIHGSNTFGEIADLIETLRDENAELKIPMPGAWICDKCGFVLQKNILFTRSGNVGADHRDECEGCPNDGEAMRAFTWREANKSYADFCDKQIERRGQLEAVVRKCNFILCVLDGDVNRTIQSLVDEALYAVRELKLEPALPAAPRETSSQRPVAVPN